MTLLLAQIGGGSVVYSLTCSTGSYAITGKDASIVCSRKLDAVNGSYAITGKDASIVCSRKLDAVNGSYAITGKDASIIFTPNRVLIALSGSYSIIGQDVTFVPSVTTKPKRFGVGYWVDPKPIVEEVEEEIEYYEPTILDRLISTKDTHNKLVEKYISSEFDKEQRKLKIRKRQDELVISMYFERKRLILRKAQDELIITMYAKGIKW